MRKLFFAVMVLISVDAFAQDATIRQANLDRMNYRKGTMILYYGANRLVQNVSLYTVDFKKEDSEDRIAGILKERHKTPVPYMYFEFKEGYDCRNAQNYLSGKGINKMAFGNCLDVSFKENPQGSYVQPGGGRTYWNDPANVTEERVMQLDTYSWALVNKVLEKRQEELEKNGWKRVYAEYNLAGGPDDNRWVGKGFSVSTDSIYKAIAVVLKANYQLKLVNSDEKDNEGYNKLEDFEEYAADSLGETITFYPNKSITKLIAAAVSTDKVNTNPAGILYYRKKYSFSDDFESVLNNAKDNFKSFIVKETKDPNGVTVFITKTTFGIKSQMVYQSTSDKQWLYRMIVNPGAPESERIKSSVIKKINELEKTGNYTIESGKMNDAMIYRLNDKNNNRLFQMVEEPSKRILLFFYGGK